MIKKDLFSQCGRNFVFKNTMSYDTKNTNKYEVFTHFALDLLILRTYVNIIKTRTYYACLKSHKL